MMLDIFRIELVDRRYRLGFEFLFSIVVFEIWISRRVGGKGSYFFSGVI